MQATHAVDSAPSEFSDPRLPAPLLWISVAECAVLAGAAALLFLAPTTARDIWPWLLTPFNTRFLGALYLASLANIVPLLVVRRRVPARVVTAMLLVFSTIVFFTSIGHPHQFRWSEPSAYAWFFLFVSVPTAAAYYTWYLWTRVPLPAPSRSRLRPWLLAAAVPLGGYGFALLFAPNTAADFWPWPLDEFHARVYSGIFLTLAVGAAIVARAGFAAERRTLGATGAVMGAFAIVALGVVDADVHKVDWTTAGTVAWLAMFGAMALGGAALAVSARGG